MGFFVGYAFGARPSVEVGLDIRWVKLEDGTFGCADPSSLRYGSGPFAQIAILGKSRPRITLGMFGGFELQAAGPSALGELGASVRFDQGAHFGLHTGEMLEVTWPKLYASQGWFLDEYAVGGAFSVFPILGLPSECDDWGSAVPGRPPRDAWGATYGTSARDARITPQLSREAREWHHSAELECASIRAFLELAQDLLLAGAPLELIHRALDAAEDEIVHAELCAALASASSGGPLRPMLVDAAHRPAPSLETLLARLAVEGYFDGCLGEGSAAFRARVAADEEREPLLRTVQRRIATDEARHARARLGNRGVDSGARRLRDSPRPRRMSHGPRAF